MNLEERLIVWLELNQRPCEERDLLNDAYERLEQLASANRALSRANTHVTARLAAAEALDRDYQEVRDRLDAANARLAAAEADQRRWRYVRDNSTLAGETQEGVYLWEWEALDRNADSIDADVDASIEAAKGGRE